MSKITIVIKHYVF